MPFGDKSIMQFLLVTLQPGQAHVLRYTFQKGPGSGARVQAFCVQRVGGGRGRKATQQMALLLITLLPMMFIVNTMTSVKIPGTAVHSGPQDTVSHRPTTGQTTEQKGSGHVKPYFYQPEENFSSFWYRL